MMKIKFAYFCGEPLGVPVLKELEAAGLLPSLVVCNPDRPAGRGKMLTSPPVKVWAAEHSIPVYQPTNYKDGTVQEFLSQQDWDLFVVVAYNFILPKWLLELPKHKTLNVHPSLLPKLRGASPIRSAILEDEPESVGVTVMLLDQQMDHGPIIDQQALSISPNNWPVAGPELDQVLASAGGSLLAEVVPAWVAGEIESQEQPHELATYCGRLEKKDFELAIDPLDLPTGVAGRQAWLKINAFAGIGDAFFMYDGKRVKVKQAEFAGGKLRLLRVTPEGKKEMAFADYLQSIGK